MQESGFANSQASTSVNERSQSWK